MAGQFQGDFAGYAFCKVPFRVFLARRMSVTEQPVAQKEEKDD